ncbi:hypothetical protein AEA09_08220 [Lysinibacillus contaminans]|uniref:Uncharacterized protein n=1 Tax=Lysinibacillus contaminans TaxID=1293441 RepID=A0ABR5K0T1_9BACI|nr:hypothetical protein [Lysinibacillus contaminans]KOS68537.1 hypothetical protein AEA09_08220 [Lysinibacillus contaminans]
MIEVTFALIVENILEISPVKTSEEARKLENEIYKLVMENKNKYIIKAFEYAEEIKSKAKIPVKIKEKIQGAPKVCTVYEQNMWHGRQVLQDIDDDY